MVFLKEFPSIVEDMKKLGKKIEEARLGHLGYSMCNVCKERGGK
jgi:hypothetical protein